MYPTLVLSILLCFVTFQVGITTNEIPGDQNLEVVTLAAPIGPSPPPNTTVEPSNVTTIAPITTPTPITTVPTKTTTPNSTTTATTPTTSKPSTTTVPTTPTTAPTTKPTNATTTTPITTTTASTPTTSAPSPSPSDRKFDAFSFLGGLALGLGLVAIGFLSWKFYLSRREDYYHTL